MIVNKIILSTLVIVFAFFITGCESKPQEQSQKIVQHSVKKEIPSKSSFSLKTTEGETISFDVDKGILVSKQLNGKVVLINFFATWCSPCRKEMPAFAQLQEKYKDDFIVIGILLEEDKDKKELDDFIKKYKINFPITVGEQNFELAEAYGGVKMLPESFIYSKEGLLLDEVVGIVDEFKLEKQIKESIK